MIGLNNMTEQGKATWNNVKKYDKISDFFNPMMGNICIPASVYNSDEQIRNEITEFLKKEKSVDKDEVWALQYCSHECYEEDFWCLWETKEWC